MKKNTTPKQLAANRRNAQKSTGPRTPKGRAVSKMNAMKHGILSKQVLVNGLVLQESSAELEALHRRFWEDLQPVGVMEEMLVDQIVTAHWRLRRALTAESGEIALSVDTGHRKRSNGTGPVMQWMLWRTHTDTIHAMEKSAIGSAFLQDWVRELRDRVEAEGELTEAMVRRFTGHFGDQPNFLTNRLTELLRNQEANPEGMDAGALRDRNKAAALAFLDGQAGSFRMWKEQRLDEEEYEEEARQAAAVLPSAETLDKILRYETTLNRQLSRAMAQLERVQRRRQGEDIPAPLSVEVSDRG